MKETEPLIDPIVLESMRLGEKMMAIYKLRNSKKCSWKDLGASFKVDPKQASNMCGRVHEWINFYGMREEAILDFAKVFGKFCEDRDVTRLISLMAMNNILSLSELNEINLDRKIINGVGERYTQILKNTQTYMRKGAGYNRTIHITISEYAYELLKKECERGQERPGKVITRALLFYCGIEDQKKEE